MNTPAKQRTPAPATRTRVAVPGPTHQSDNTKARGAIAANALSGFGATESNYIHQQQLSSIKPSKKNPRRLTIDAAGVTDAVIEQLKPKLDEPHADWLERIDRYANRPSPEKHFWRGLVTLAGSLKTSGLVQPIVVDSEGEIIAGERRWLALRIAGFEACPVLVRSASSASLMQAREILAFVENEHRQNLKPVEVIFGARQIADTLMGGCGQDNKEHLGIAAFQEVTGAGRTACAAYASFARLDGDDPLLEEFHLNPPRSIKAAHAAASARLKEIERGAKAAVFEGTGVAVPEPARSGTMNVSVPTGSGMKNLLGWLGKEAPLNSLTSQVLNALVGDWDQVDDKERRARLSEVFQHIADSMADGHEGEGGADAN